MHDLALGQHPNHLAVVVDNDKRANVALRHPLHRRADDEAQLGEEFVVVDDDGEVVEMSPSAKCARTADSDESVADVVTRRPVTCGPDDGLAGGHDRTWCHFPRITSQQPAVLELVSIGDLVKARLGELEFKSNVLTTRLRVRWILFNGGWVGRGSLPRERQVPVLDRHERERAMELHPLVVAEYITSETVRVAGGDYGRGQRWPVGSSRSQWHPGRNR